MKHNTLSVIVNIYNEALLLKECVDSLLKQSYVPMEIILVDDGSSDDSPEICSEYAATYPHISCILKENAGLVAARKSGIHRATGEYVAFVDGDDTLHPEYFQVMMSEIETYNVDIVIAGHTEVLGGIHQRVRYNGLPAGRYDKGKLSSHVYPYMMNMGEEAEFGIFSYLWNKVFRLQLLKTEMMQVDDRIFIGEDACSVYPTLLRASHISILEYAGYYYRQRPGSMVKKVEQGEIERKRLHYLGQYLKYRFCQLGHYQTLHVQLQSFICNQICVRTDGMYPALQDNPYFPFRVPECARLVLYGAGTFGQQLFRRLNKITPSIVLTWVDEQAELYQDFGLPVQMINVDLLKQADYILIARIQNSMGDYTDTHLLNIGIEKNKILRPLLTQTERELLCTQLNLY